MSDSSVGRPGWSSVIRKSSGAVHRNEPQGPCAEDSVQLRLAVDDRPKSVRQAQPELLIRMLALINNKMGKNEDIDRSIQSDCAPDIPL